MTDLFFVKNKSSVGSYFVKNIELSISSLEEFVYFYAKNIVLIDDSILQEDFEYWIETQLEFPVLAKSLRQIRLQEEGCIAYFGTILKEMTIFSPEEKEEILREARNFANRNENQRRKLLGDRLYIREKYQSAIKEYYGLTLEESFSYEENSFIGSVWHNLGCCYGMCFMFEEALECLKKAYSYNFMPKTQDAVAWIMKVMNEERDEDEGANENFLNYLDYTTQDGRDVRYEQLNERIKEYRRGVEE